MPTTLATHPLHEQIERVRRFNRFYTRQIGVVRDGLLDSPYSLAEARVLFEIAHRAETTARDLAAFLSLDAGYLSRMLTAFEQRALIERRPSTHDGRHRVISLTQTGQSAFAELNNRSRAMLERMLATLSPDRRAELVTAMGRIEAILAAPPAPWAGQLVVRPHKPGDIGWIIHRHGVIYHQEYGWDEQFEALVGSILSTFAAEHDAQRERSWVAEIDGQFAGCVFLVRKDDQVARLRCLLVEPAARGHGVGTRLVNDCVAFARTAGYRQVTLWTNDILHAARRIYQRAGFHLTEEDHHHSFGHDLIGQHWLLDL